MRNEEKMFVTLNVMIYFKEIKIIRESSISLLNFFFFEETWHMNIVSGLLMIQSLKLGEKNALLEYGSLKILHLNEIEQKALFCNISIL